MIKTIQTSSTWNGGEITKDMYAEIQQGMIDSAETIADRARALVPVDEGDLRGTIRAKGRRKKSNLELAAARLSRGDYETALPGAWVFAGDRDNNIYYAHMVEFGTYFKSAHPFMRPAVDANFNAVLAEAERAGKRALNKRRRQRRRA